MASSIFPLIVTSTCYVYAIGHVICRNIIQLLARSLISIAVCIPSFYPLRHENLRTYYENKPASLRATKILADDRNQHLFTYPFGFAFLNSII
ncbi:hypothetical protein GGP41_006238 [Bipolaris sorokiniana]|uniref:Uncharacterized protein n=1 Tax=Cochliobolus sativus TaxID=45130 RepID=A0A8H6DWQ7_COCSA|nr:hypothetical protein GGP41_006238 [Bipolaris sorokiniana]